MFIYYIFFFFAVKYNVVRKYIIEKWDILNEDKRKRKQSVKE